MGTAFTTRARTRFTAATSKWFLIPICARRWFRLYFMDGMYDDNFYFNNPVDYLSNASDPWFYEQIASCDIHLSTGTGPWENSGPTYRLSEVLSSKGIRHSLDNWGPQGGHDWPYWKHQMREYVSQLF